MLGRCKNPLVKTYMEYIVVVQNAAEKVRKVGYVLESNLIY